MQVETFECAETAAEPIETSEEALALIEEMDLAGQREFVCKSDKSGRDTRCPYRVITAEEMFVYRTLCPTETRLARYADAPIPLRVLQVAAHAKSLGKFNELLVWHRAAPEIKDPVLIARDKGEYAHDRKYFILARWGEELETFVTLCQRAATKAKEATYQKLNQIIARATADLAKVEAARFDDLVAWNEPRYDGPQS